MTLLTHKFTGNQQIKDIYIKLEFTFPITMEKNNS